MKSIIKNILLINILLIFSACSEKTDKSEEKDLLLNSAWKLVGFVDVETEKMKEAEPTDEWCFILRFKEGNFTPELSNSLEGGKKLSGSSSTNSFEGAYEIDESKNSINISIGLMTQVNEYLDGELYMKSLKNTDFFSLEEDELKLYYNNGQNYLLFKSQ